MSIQGSIEYLKKVSSNIGKIEDVAAQVVMDHQDVILSLNREQMLLGRDASGEILTPGYTDDTYFKTPKQAEWYKRMKKGLESQHISRMYFSNAQLYPNKGDNTPNLIVTGPFQDNMFINASKDKYEMGSTYIDAGDINAKYNNNVFGLAPKSKEYFYRYFIKPELSKGLMK